jgi:hypothetical protein
MPHMKIFCDSYFGLLYRPNLLKLQNKVVAGTLLCKLGLSAAATVPKVSYLPALTASHPATP